MQKMYNLHQGKKAFGLQCKKHALHSRPLFISTFTAAAAYTQMPSRTLRKATQTACSPGSVPRGQAGLQQGLKQHGMQDRAKKLQPYFYFVPFSEIFAIKKPQA
jgi:hypothetical protein